MNYKLETLVGETFSTVAEKAKEISIEKNQTVEFDFNGVKCLVNSGTNLRYFRRDYFNSWLMEWKSVGANCVEKYDTKTQKELDKKRDESEKKQAKEAEQRREKENAEREVFEKKTKGVEIELKDIDGWKKSREANTDPYGKAALDYAEGWAKLMQVEISKGKTVTECANRTSLELGFMGITGFMFGCAVGILYQVWIHGEELNKWHKSK